MLKLTEDFFIVSIEKYNWNNTKIENKKTYTFRYKSYKIELTPSFSVLGYTKEDNIVILNFGYVVDIEKWSDKDQCFRYIRGFDNQDGSSTKKYLDSQEARELILRFLERYINRYLKNINPSIVIRGALSEIKIKLPRYARMDQQFFSNNYHKKEIDITTDDSLYQITMAKDEADKAIWVYCKKESYFEQLQEVI